MSSLSIIYKISLVKEIYLNFHSLYTGLNSYIILLFTNWSFFWTAHLFRPLTFYFKVRFCYLLLFNHFRSFKSSRKKREIVQNQHEMLIKLHGFLKVCTNSTYKKNPLGTSLSTCLSLIGLHQVLFVFIWNLNNGVWKHRLDTK